MKADGSLDKFKARLVAKGFQQHAGVDFSNTFSPVVKVSTIRIIFTLVVAYNWDIQQIDINYAFLNGILHKNVYMCQPVGFGSSTHPTHVCKLIKSLYGLKQTPRAWFVQLRNALVSWGFQPSIYDNSLFHSRKNGHLVLVLVYVDDILITGDSSTLIHSVIQALTSRFALKTLGSISYFLVFEAFRDNSGLYLN